MVNKKLLLPAVKHKMGNREYILCAMPAHEVVARVSLAADITGKDMLLSEMTVEDVLPSEKLQRRLKEKRLNDIAKYLGTDDRFFSVLVIALCGNTARWRAFSNLKGEGVGEQHKEALGFLSLTGAEEMYALDGQHRLRGLKKAIEPDKAVRNDMVSLLIVHHDTDRPKTGRQASRRLFTVLNKHAEKPAKRDIIYLDEDNLVAVTVRRLIESSEYADMFGLETRVHESAVNQFPQPDTTSCFTTVGTLYDCVLALAISHTGKAKKDIENSPVVAANVDEMCELVRRVFWKIRKSVGEVDQYFKVNGKNAKKLNEIVRRCNKNQVLFRPMGLKQLIECACALRKKRADKSIEKCAEICCQQLPLDMQESPLAGLVWDVKQEKVIVKGFPVLKAIYQHVLGVGKTSKTAEAELEKKYQNAVNDDAAKLPKKLVI